MVVRSGHRCLSASTPSAWSGRVSLLPTGPDCETEARRGGSTTFGAHLAQKGVDMAVIRDLLGHHSVTLTEKYYAHLAASSLASAVQRLNKKEDLLPKLLPKTKNAPFSGTENGELELPLTDSFERCYVPEVALLAGVAKLAYAADSKSAGT